MDRHASGPLGRLAYPPPADATRPGLFQVLWRRKSLVMIPVIVALGLAVVYLITEPKRYMCAARLQVTPARIANEGSDYSQSSNFLNTEAEKVLSHGVLALTLAQTIPADSGLPDMIGKPIKLLRTFKETDSTPLTALRDFADVSVGRKDDALTVTYETPFREEAPIISNAIVNAFSEYQNKPKLSNVQSELDVLHKQKALEEAKLEKIKTEMAAMESQYGFLTKNGEDNITYRRLTQSTQDRIGAHSETLKAKADFDDAKALAGDRPPPLGSIIAADDEQVLRANLSQLQSKLRDMQTHYLSQHPALQTLQQKVDQAAGEYVEAVRRRWLRAADAEKQVESRYNKDYDDFMKIVPHAATYARLSVDAEGISRRIIPIETQITSVEMQQAAPAVHVEFWEPAEITRVKKSHPSVAKALGLGLAAGLFLGCCLALIRDRMDDRLHSSDEIKSSLGVPLLGAVPQMPAGISPADAGQRVLLEPDGEVSEAFRSIRTAISFGAPKDRCRTMLITSPNPGDGKSTAAANLAIVTAQAGKKVLLIDADLRNPRINALFNLGDTRVGLSSLLNGQGTWDQAIQRSPIDGLDLLPCGNRPRNASEMLNSPMFSELLEMLAEKYDQIIIDSPPVLGLADARIVAASCDLTVLVLRAGKSTRKLSGLAKEGLAAVGANVIGVIVNDVSRRDEASFEGTYGYPNAAREPEPQSPSAAADPAPAGDAPPEASAPAADPENSPADDARTDVLARRMADAPVQGMPTMDSERPRRTARRRET